MKKYLLVWVWMYVSLSATTVLIPSLQIEANGTVKDMVLHENTLLLATDNGQAQLYDVSRETFIQTLYLPPVKDFMGDLIPARIFSVDVMDGRYLLLSDSGKGGYANLWIEEKGKRSLLFSADEKQAAIKARFISKDKILLGYLSNEAVLFDVVSKKEIYRVQLSASKFSDFALNLDRRQAVFACESGILNIINTRSGKVLHVLEGVNVDNVYKVDFKQNVVSGAGQDRRASLYEVKQEKGVYIKAGFLIYATGLSPSAKRVAFALDEQNNITVFDRLSQHKLFVLKGLKSTANTILFQDENKVFSSSDDSHVMMWELP